MVRPPHQRRTQQGEERRLPAAQGILLRQRHKGDGRLRQAQKQAAHEVDMVGEQARQQRHAQAHADDPAHAQLQEIGQRCFPGGVVPVEQVVEGIDEAVIEAQNERHRAAGHTGHAVRQRHAKAVKGRQESHSHTVAFFRWGASRTIRNAATARRLPAKPRIIHRDLFMPSLTALRYSHAAVSSQ